MQIGVLTHNYPRFPGDFSGTFVDALCEEFSRTDDVTVWAPYDPAYQWPTAAQGSARPGSRVQLRLYRYAWPDSLHRLGYMRSMHSDLTLRLENYALSPLFFASGIAAVMAQARRLRPAVLHAHWALPNGFIAAVVSRRLGIPLAVSIPGSDAHVAAKNALFRAMARFVFRQAGLLTANSAELRDAAIALGADPSRFDLIIYGTDPAGLRPDAAGVAELREQWRSLAKLTPAVEPCFVLCVGRMVHKKGFDVLIRALAEPPLCERPVVAVMVGGGDEQANWQRLAQEVGVAHRVLWVGFVSKEHIGRYYNAANALAMPSVSKPADGLNVCVLDAMSCAKPVVASNVAGNPLAVTDGETGFITPEGDAAALARALARLADDPDLRQRMGAAGRRRIEKELGWPHLARRYRAHFQRLQEKN